MDSGVGERKGAAFWLEQESKSSPLRVLRGWVAVGTKASEEEQATSEGPLSCEEFPRGS